MQDEIKAISHQEDFLTGGGEMGERIRNFDWASNPLGAPANWPNSLKTIVRIMLTSQQPIWIGWGKDLIKLYNDPYKAIVGGKDSWALGQPASVVWKEIRQDIDPMLRHVMQKNVGTYVDSHLLIMERYGYPEETYYTFSYSPVPDDNGNIGGMFCANTDSTQRVIGERQLALLRELASKTLNASGVEEIFAKTSESLATNKKDLPFSMLYQMTEDGHSFRLVGSSVIERGHQAAPDLIDLLNISSWPIKEALDMGNSVIVSDLKDRFANLPSGEWDRPPHTAIIVPVSQSGQPLFLVAGLNPLRLFNDEYKGFINLAAGQISQSMQNVLALEEERRRAAALAEIDKAKTIFFSNVSHEFRTPLTLMLGPLQEVLSRDTLTDAQSKEQLTVVYRNSLRLLRLVNTLLDFSRIEAGKMQAVYRKTNLGRLTADLSSSFRSAIETAGLKFNTAFENITDPVYIDHTMWERIVFNLLSNALKFTFQGEIDISLKQKDHHIELKVKDTGTGIPKEELSKLFSRFHRIENSKGRTHEGSGIGLAMVSELVKMHGGSVEVDSALGEGTTFTVTIPTGKDHLPTDRIAVTDTVKSITLNAIPNLEEELSNYNLDAAYQASDRSMKVSHTEKGVRDKVLIADDNADMREYISNLLKDRYDVIQVKDGVEALQALRWEKPSLILSDIMMPNLDGIGLTRQIRSDARTATLPVILVSARAGEESTVEGIRAGADDYLVKPFSAKELVSRVESNIRIAKTRQLAEENLKNVFKQAHFAVTLLRGEDFIIELANPKAIELWGKPAEEVMNKPILQALPEIEAQGFGDLLKQVYFTGERFVGNEAPVELIRYGKSETVYLNFIYDCWRDTDGKTIGIMALAYDVTELVMARKLAEQTSQKLEEANRDIISKNDMLTRINNDLDNFIYTASHDLKAPVANIEGLLHSMTDALSEENKNNEEFQSILDLIQKSITRFKNTILDLTEISKAQKLYEEDVEKISCNEIIDDVRLTIREQINLAQAEIKVNVSECEHLRFSRKNFQSIVYNLLSNAIKYRDPERALVVTVTTKSEDGYMILKVSDNGLGINESNKAKLFTMFKRFHDHVEGTGIGLYIVKKIIDNAGGKIEVESALKKGTTFKIYFPVSTYEMPV